MRTAVKAGLLVGNIEDNSRDAFHCFTIMQNTIAARAILLLRFASRSAFVVLHHYCDILSVEISFRAWPMAMMTTPQPYFIPVGRIDRVDIYQMADLDDWWLFATFLCLLRIKSSPVADRSVCVCKCCARAEGTTLSHRSGSSPFAALGNLGSWTQLLICDASGVYGPFVLPVCVTCQWLLVPLQVSSVPGNALYSC